MSEVITKFGDNLRSIVVNTFGTIASVFKKINSTIGEDSNKYKKLPTFK